MTNGMMDLPDKPMERMLVLTYLQFATSKTDEVEY